jgi:pantoate--beta-alanine ligase
MIWVLRRPYSSHDSPGSRLCPGVGRHHVRPESFDLCRPHGKHDDPNHSIERDAAVSCCPSCRAFYQGFDDTAEGRARPGHFRGVATIVIKLLNIVQPTRAYFGQKDAAQCVLIRRIVADLDLDVLVHVEPTVREPDGLAMSSRNAYLTVQERTAAPVVYRALMAAQQRFDNLRDGDDAESIDSDALRSAVEEVLKSEPLVTSIQYVAIDNPHTMQPLDRVQKSATGGGGGAIVSVACKLGNVRLIDNIMLG